LSLKDHFQAKLEKIFLAPADTFDNVKGQFPIGFKIWNTNKKEIFENVEKYIKKPGHFYFPIISLSNVEYIKEYSFSKFNKIKKIKRFNWPLPEEMMTNFETLKNLKEKKCVDFKEVFGMIICYTDVYEVSFE
jgi:hypothetical protein